MTIAYTGLPGSGKTYTVVESVILPALKAGRDVYTNIPMSAVVLEEYEEKLHKLDLAKAQLEGDYFQKNVKKGSYIVIDEAWRLWPSGLKMNRAHEGHKALISEHRHWVNEQGESTQIVIITQDLAQIATFVRNLVDYTYRHTKLKSVGAENRYRTDIYEGPVTGPSPPKAKLIKQEFGKYERAIFELYNSHTMSESVTGQVNEKTVDTRHNVLKRTLTVIAACIVAAFALSYYVMAKVIGGGASEESSVMQSPEVEYMSPGEQRQDVLQGYQIDIVFNNTDGRRIDYVFRAEKDGAYSVLNVSHLTMMGYSVEAVSQCMAVIRKGTSTYIANCRDINEKREERPDYEISVFDKDKI